MLSGESIDFTIRVRRRSRSRPCRGSASVGQEGGPADRTDPLWSWATSTFGTPPAASTLQMGSFAGAVEEDDAVRVPGAVRTGRRVADGLRRAARDRDLAAVFRPRQKAINLLSGDQIGRSAPSVPGSGARLEGVERADPDLPPPVALAASKAIMRPSGETDGRPDVGDAFRIREHEAHRRAEAPALFGPTRSRSRWRAGRGRAVAAQATRSRDAVAATDTATGMPARDPPSAIHCSSAATSRALCQRSSGSFSMHLRTT